MARLPNFMVPNLFFIGTEQINMTIKGNSASILHPPHPTPPAAPPPNRRKRNTNSFSTYTSTGRSAARTHPRAQTRGKGRKKKEMLRHAAHRLTSRAAAGSISRRALATNKEVYSIAPSTPPSDPRFARVRPGFRGVRAI
jgi:hypothetical protein